MTYYNDHLVYLIQKGAKMEEVLRDTMTYFETTEYHARRILKTHGISFPTTKDDESK